MKRRVVSGVLLILLYFGLFTFALNIQPVRASGTICIRPDGTVEGTDKIQRNGDIYTFIDNVYDEIVVERDNIVVDGAGYTVQSTGGWSGINMTERNNVTIKNIEVKAFVYGFWLSKSSNCTISGNNITKNSVYNVFIQHSSNNSINENSIANSSNGIFLTSLSSTNIINGNLITNNSCGLYLGSSANNHVFGNNITQNLFKGVYVRQSSNNTIEKNCITGDDLGVHLDSSPNNTIKKNNITNNAYGGVEFAYSSENTFCQNTVGKNGAGLRLFRSSNNLFYHNNLINNTGQVYQADLVPRKNTWDDGYPSGGNYWSDFAGVDEKSGPNQDVLGSDGIWDQPYEIDASNLDDYPLVEPWIPVERKVGVKVGDWVKYGKFDVAWSSNDPDSEMPVGIAILRETEWLENSVKAIPGNKIEYQQLLHFKNGSEYSTTCWIDIDTGSGTALTFISSGLVPNDCIYASAPWFAWKLNETTSRQYIGVPREVNCLNITTSMQFGPPPAYPNSTGDFYWDDETGVLCELSMKHLNQTGSYVTSWSVFYETVATNLWEAPNPAEETQELIETLETWNLPKGTENSLSSKLKGAIHLLNIGNENGAIHKLMDFINQVEAQRGKKLIDDQADYLTTEAQRIINLIEG